jgi:hypothetical protein
MAASQTEAAQQTADPAAQDVFSPFWELSPAERSAALLAAILDAHTHHYECNPAYRRTVSARGISAQAAPADLPRLLRPTAQTFKSYIDILGTPFPQDQPHGFLNWLADQLSVEIPRDRFERFQPRYKSLEALLADFEHHYADYGFEVSTSSGTSGRSTIMLRDQDSMDKTVESFYLAFQRYIGMQADHRVVFIMPKHTRIAMVRMARFSFMRVGLAEARVHFTIPFPAEPDQVRIRSGRTFRPGFSGLIEQRFWHPFMNWANERIVMPRAVTQTMDILQAALADGDKILVFGSWVQLHTIALLLAERGQTLKLPPGSLLGSGGGFKELYPFNLPQIQADIARVITLADGAPIPLRDVYGMAEGNWAAMQCAHGNYHIPPWIYALTLDPDDRVQEVPDSTGMLAFYDPIGGGNLFPAFFKTADRMRLINGATAYDPALDCPCGQISAYITKGSIQRVDLIDEAGCAAQI